MKKNVDRTGTFHLPAQAAIESSELWSEHMQKILDLARLVIGLIDEFGVFTFCMSQWPKNYALTTRAARLAFEATTRAEVLTLLKGFAHRYQLMDLLQIKDRALKNPEFDLVRPILQAWFIKNWPERAQEERDMYVWLLEGQMGGSMFSDVIAICGGTKKLKAELARVLIAEYSRHLIV